MSKKWSDNKGVQIIAEVNAAAIPLSAMGSLPDAASAHSASTNKGVDSLLEMTHQVIGLQGPRTELDYQNDPSEEFIEQGSLLGSVQSVLASEFIPKLRAAPTHFLVPLTKMIFPFIQLLSRRDDLSFACSNAEAGCQSSQEEFGDFLSSEVIAEVLFGTDGFPPGPTPLAIWLGCLVQARAKHLGAQGESLAQSETGDSDHSNGSPNNDHSDWFLAFWERIEAVLHPRLSEFELRFLDVLKKERRAESVAKEMDLSKAYCATILRRLRAMARECFEPCVSGVSV